MILLRALTVAVVGTSAAAQPAPQEMSYGIHSGDKITVQLFTAAGQQVNVVGGERIVDVNGELFLPYVGTLSVAGLDESGLRSVLSTAYGVFYPDVVIDVTVELRVNVTGAVRNPGQYFLDPTSTLIDALAAAGGMFAELAATAASLPADQTHVRVVRDGQTQIVNLRPGDASDDELGIRVRSGDWVDVPYQGRSRIRDNILFFGTVVSFFSGIATLVLLIR